MKYFWLDGQWVPGWMVRAVRASGSLPAPNIISDDMDALRHPVTGKMSESKSAFRAMTRAAGCRELGNDAPTEPAKSVPDRTRRNDIQRAWQKLEQGYKPATVAPLSPGTARVYGG